MGTVPLGRAFVHSLMQEENTSCSHTWHAGVRANQTYQPPLHSRLCKITSKFCFRCYDCISLFTRQIVTVATQAAEITKRGSSSQMQFKMQFIPATWNAGAGTEIWCLLQTPMDSKYSNIQQDDGERTTNRPFFPPFSHLTAKATWNARTCQEAF